MTNDGGRAGEPTSYGLRPPGPAWPNPYAGPDVGTLNGASVGDAEPHLVGGRYRLVSRLGHGGMGTVWKAHDEVVDREVAVKEPRVPDHLPESARLNVHQRMRQEARAAARVAHPSVVAVHDVVIEDGRPWIVMELVRGESLAGRLDGGTLDVREAARIGLAVLGALTAAHAAGVLHRDVKPDNILLGAEDRVVLTDFGIARIEGEQGLTETGGFVGSPEYVAPERALGQLPGPASDLWSLGVVLYAAVEGMSPFRRTNAQATMQAILSAEPPRPTHGPEAFTGLLTRLLSKDPAARPAADGIREVLESLTRPAPLPVPSAPGNRWVPPVLHRNRKLQWSLGAGLFVVGAAVALVAINPFGYGPATPLHWKVRDEPEIVRASITVPEDYVKSIDTDKRIVSFKDPGGVYTISLTRREEDPKDKEQRVGSAREEASKLKSRFEKGEVSSVNDARSTVSSAKPVQGHEAADVTTVYRKSYADAEDPKGFRHTRVIVNKARNGAWSVEVAMPEKGKARTQGEKLFDEVLRYLKLQG
ncbi:serine/threonine protein kinase [Streptomyces sp. AV19]|uniref:serine/threonine-protein kinase n=1 Tax=Streptomyces sp. AV19 TaxID=2793068 RepID=UPI0018FE4951|nr:serine/threonine-protein kinase [Streptomyces sp. AV19]MBH1933032.1 serine/threonine protein kinase [Streptomyces sp. AV19]MDG4531745.1 serine/threonine protein kinase [Streptomyces sp. AV19]